MTLFERPRAIRISTSRSRGVRSSTWAGAPPPWAISSTTRVAIVGESGAVAVVGGADRAHELGGLDVLEQVAGGAGAQRGEELVVVAEARQHDDPRARALAQALQRADAVEPRHHEVEQDHVGVGARGGVDRGLAVAGLGDDLDVVLEVEERAQALAHDRVVVGEQDADHARHLQPDGRAGAERRGRPCSVPPSSVARSSIDVSPSRWPRTSGPAGSKPQPSSVTVSTSRRRRSAHLDRVGAGVAQRVAERLLGDPQHLRRAAPGRAAARRTTRRSICRPETRRSTSTCLRSTVASPSASSDPGRSSKTTARSSSIAPRASSLTRSSSAAARAAVARRAASRPTPPPARRRTAAA